jgi:DNA-binding NtrC family response regulator
VPWNDTITKTVNVAIFEDTPAVLSIYVRRLRRIDGVSLPYTNPVYSPGAALSLFRRFRPEIVITDLSLSQPARADGIDILHAIKGMSPGTPVALATLHTPGSTTLSAQEIERAGFDAIFNKIDFAGISEFVRTNAAKIRFG